MEINYNIEKNVGQLGTNSKGWTKEVNLISWNNREPKIDIRDWSEDHSKMGKGITLTKEECESLINVLGEYLNSF